MTSSADDTISAANSTLSENSQRAILEEMAWKNFIRLMPIVLFCALLAVIGTIGNSVTVCVFLARMRRNFMNDLFILLSGTSLLACAVCLPMEIYDIYNTYILPSIAVCKVSRYFNLLSTTCLVTTLFSLAIYRLRAAQASRSQSPSLKTKVLVFIAMSVWCFGFSLFGIRVYGRKTIFVTIERENSSQVLLGQDCAVGDDVEHTLWPMAYNLSMATGFLSLTITTIACYYRIWRLVVRSRLAVAAHVTSSNPVNEKLATTSGTIADDMDLSVNNEHNVISQAVKREGDIHTDKFNGTTKDTNDNTRLKEHGQTYPDVDTEAKEPITKEMEDTLKDSFSSKDLISNAKHEASDYCSASYQPTNTKNLIESNNKNLYSVPDTCINAIEVRNLSPLALDSDLKSPGDSKTNHLFVISQDPAIPRLNTIDFNKGVLNKTTISNRANRIDCNQSLASVTDNDIVSEESNNTFHIPSKESTLAGRYPASSTKESNTLNIDKVILKQPVHTPVELFRADSSILSQPKLPLKNSSKSPLNIKDAAPASENISRKAAKSTVKSNFSTESKDTAPTRDSQKAPKSTFDSNSSKDKKVAAYRRNSRKAPKSTLESNITKTALLLAVTFIVCYVPFFCVSIPSLLYPSLNYDSSAWGLNFKHLAYRLYFVTPAINPLIFYASNLDFRRKIKELVVKRKRDGR